jgi:hypothetical protein
MDRVRWVRCAHCGEIIGAYEAARLVLRDGSHRCGSRSTLGELIKTPDAAVVHEGCYATFQQMRNGGSAAADARSPML